jgi:predicted adenylyl cyclase CyaB
MAIEIEKKYRINDEQHQFVLKALNEFNAVYIGEDLEENTLYGGGILETKPCVFRLRKIGERGTVTYKEPIESEFAIKKRLEHETEVLNVAAMESIISGLGLSPVLIYEKRRKTWHFRSVEIVIDELSFGMFMEIEGSVTAIAEAEMILGIEHFETEYQSYPSLTLLYGIESESVFEARFVKT